MVTNYCMQNSKRYTNYMNNLLDSVAERVGLFRIALKHVYSSYVSDLPVQVRCMRRASELVCLDQRMGWGGGGETDEWEHICHGIHINVS